MDTLLNSPFYPFNGEYVFHLQCFLLRSLLFFVNIKIKGKLKYKFTLLIEVRGGVFSFNLLKKLIF